MTDKTHKNAVSAFYQDRFNSRPENLLDYCFSEVAEAAAQAGIDWQSISNAVILTAGKQGAKFTGKIGVIDKRRHRGKVMAWGGLREIRLDDATFEVPYLTFYNNSASIGTVNWDGGAALFDLFSRQSGQAPTAAQEQWRKAQESKAAERARRQEEAEQNEREDHARRIAERNAYEQVWFQGGAVEFPCLRNGKPGTDVVELIGDEDGSAPYLQRKQIGDIASVCRMQRMRDRSGEFTAVPLYNIHGEFGGLQRLYADKKLQGTGVKMDGLHVVLGDIEDADRVYAAEGFATGASIYLAEQANKKQVAVIITFSVGNLLKVLAQYKRHRDKMKIINAADEDQWKSTGNAGRLAALEIHREYGYSAILPDFFFAGLTLEEAATARLTGKGPTDWNDFHLLHGLKATAKALRSHASLKAEKDFFLYSLQRVRASGLKDESAALSAVNAGMLQAPIKYGTKQVVDMVIDNLPAGFSGNVFKIKSRALWLAKIKLSEAQQLRSFSPSALARPGVRHIKIKGVRASHGGTLIPDHVADLVQSLDGFVICRSPMGSGKTDNLIGPVMRNSGRAGYLAHRVTLMDDAASRLQIRHYSDVMAFEMRDITHMACCVNSITNSKFFSTQTDRNWFTTLDTLCIDEASQVIRHVTSGPVEAPVRVMDTMLEAMAKAKRVLLCDADANDSVISLCEQASPGTPITIIEIEGSMDHVEVRFGDDEEVWQKALELINAGNRVLVASDSAENAKRLAVMALEKTPDLRLLLIYRDSKADPAVEAFLANPSEEAVKYDVLIYSPAISSGVSMTQPHFQHHIGLFSGNTVGPSDAVQMLRRDRTARSYLIGIGHSNVQRETDREAIYRGLVAADEIACAFEETSDEILLRRKKTAFDELYLSCTTNENRAKNNFANNLLLMLYADGYKVSRLAGDPLLAKLSRRNRKHAGELVFNQRLDLIDSVSTPSEEEFARLSRMEIRSEAESARVDRYQMENQLCVKVITPDDVAFYDDGGLSKVYALELLQATEAQALAFDKAQRKAKVTLTKTRFKTPARAFLRDVFSILNIDPVTGKGEFEASACRQVLAKIMESQDTAEMYNSLRLGKLVKFGAKRCCATTVVQSILRRLGLEFGKRKSHGRALYSINPERWSFIAGYVANRIEKGVHSLATHEHPCPHEARLATEPAAPLAGDTLHSSGIAVEEKYPPIALTERIYAAARAAFAPVGYSLSKLIGELTPEVANGFANAGADKTMIRYVLQHAEKALKAGGASLA